MRLGAPPAGHGGLTKGLSSLKFQSATGGRGCVSIRLERRNEPATLAPSRRQLGRARQCECSFLWYALSLGAPTDTRRRLPAHAGRRRSGGAVVGLPTRAQRRRCTVQPSGEKPGVVPHGAAKGGRGVFFTEGNTANGQSFGPRRSGARDQTVGKLQGRQRLGRRQGCCTTCTAEPRQTGSPAVTVQRTPAHAGPRWPNVQSGRRDVAA